MLLRDNSTINFDIIFNLPVYSLDYTDQNFLFTQFGLISENQAIIYTTFQFMQPHLLRGLDIVISLAGIICTLPVMLIVYFLEFIDGQPPFFFQQRVGKEKRLFTLVKFRTMKSNTESVGTHLVNPDSITKLGRFLRRSKLDELPQLFNVLIGQMSLVGPRPCLPNQITLIAERESRNVFTVRPGITGLAQIRNIDMSTPRKLAQVDEIMINKMSIGTYLKLIFATLLGKGMGDRVKQK